MNITMSEWTEREAQLVVEVRQRWPWLYKPHGSSICIEGKVLSALMTLRLERGPSLRVSIELCSSTCWTGGVTEVAEYVRQASEVRDVMLFLHGSTEYLQIWPDGTCPCGNCSGTGQTRGAVCDRCRGKGLR